MYQMPILRGLTRWCWLQVFDPVLLVFLAHVITMSSIMMKLFWAKKPLATGLRLSGPEGLVLTWLFFCCLRDIQAVTWIIFFQSGGLTKLIRGGEVWLRPNQLSQNVKFIYSRERKRSRVLVWEKRRAGFTGRC